MKKLEVRGASCWVTAVLCCACQAAMPRAPGEGGPAWMELTSEHFVVWTDAPVDDGRKLIGVMENLRQILFGVSVFNPTNDAKAIVIALRSQSEVEPYLGRDFGAMAWPPKFPLYQPGILVAIHRIDRDRRLVTHELAHLISYNALPVQPRWFAEGLASYFETIQLDEDGSFELGAPQDTWLRILQEPRQEASVARLYGGRVSVATLFACGPSRCSIDSRFYATSWAVFSYLMNERPGDLMHYIERLLELPDDQQAAAWQQVFHDLTPHQLDIVLDRWLRTGDLKIQRYKIKLREFSIAQRVLGDGEIYTVRALLDYRTGKRPTADVAAALEADPDNVLANMIGMASAQTPSLEVARRLTVAHPDDWRAWWLHKLITKDSSEAESDLARVCTLVAHTPAVLPEHSCPGAPRAK